MQTEVIEKALEYTFKDKELLKTALTHRSYINEVRIVRGDHNERFEFLGDAILQFVSSEYLFNKYPKLTEGQLSKLRASAVCEKALFEQAKKFSLGEHVLLGVGAEKEGGRQKPSILADCVEATIAAIYLDGGIEPASDFIRKFILSGVEFDEDVIDAKSRLQEHFQKLKRGFVKYRIISAEGKSNDMHYVIQAYLDDEDLECGEGSSKHSAEMQAALNTLKKLKN